MKFSAEDNNFIKIGASKQDVEVSHARLLVVMMFFAIGFFIVSFRVFDVALLDGGRDFNSASIDGSVPYKSRGNIVDRNGILLAINLSTASLYANPQVVMNVEEAVSKLSAVFSDINKDVLKSRLESDKSFIWVKRNLTPKEQYGVNSLGIPGLYFQNEEKRVYPHKNLLSHVIGYVNLDGKGISGIEKKFDEYLLEENDNAPLQLSVDIRAQGVVHDVLQQYVDDFKAVGASAIVMDVDSGEVISMVSLPDFDPNKFAEVTENQRFNRSTLGVYEMGSTFKSFNMALGLDSGVISMRDKYDVSRPIKAASFFIRDFHPKKKRLTVPEIFMYSSNIGSAKIAMDVGGEAQKEFLQRLGLLDGLAIEVPEKAHPLYPQRWSEISTMTISYGHGIAVTPLHIVQSTAALVNGGILHPATLIHKKNNDLVDGVKVINKDTSDNMRKLMRFAVKHGTGGRADASGYFVGGKTGSADKALNGDYNRKATISSFIAAFPMNKPRYVVLVMLDEPVGNASTGWYATGGMVAAPAIREIVERISPILGVMPVDGGDYEIRREFWYDDDNAKGAKLAFAGDF